MLLCSGWSHRSARVRDGDVLVLAEEIALPAPSPRFTHERAGLTQAWLGGDGGPGLDVDHDESKRYAPTPRSCARGVAARSRCETRPAAAA